LLDDNEFAYFSALYEECARPLGAFLLQDLKSPCLDSVTQFAAFMEEYERRTGFQAMSPTEFAHHRRRNFGPRCAKCGKLLRTPQASRCVECGTPRDT
jgi:hypothetical protein